MVSVEGEWKNFYIKTIKNDDYPQVLDHLKHVFYRDETMFQLVKYSEELADEVNLVVTHYLNQNDNLSLVAIDKVTNKVAGVRITFKCQKNDVRPNLSSNIPEHKIILGFVQTTMNDKNLHEKFGVDYYAEFFMTSVAREFRQQGLVSELYSRSIQLLQSQGYKLVESFFSSPHTRKAAKKIGFSELCRFYYFESKEEDGSQRFPNATPDQFVACMVKQL